MKRKNAESGPESGAILRREFMRSYLAELLGLIFSRDDYSFMVPGKPQAGGHGTPFG